jgi:hypothetical protein
VLPRAAPRTGRRLTRRLGQATPLIRAAFDLAPQLDADDQDLLPNLGIAALHLGDDEASLDFHDALLARARSTGATVMIMYSLTRRAFTELAVGRWSAAAAGAAEALPLAEGSRQPGLAALPTAHLAVLAALRGDAGAGDHLTAAEQVTAATPPESSPSSSPTSSPGRRAPVRPRTPPTLCTTCRRSAIR